MSLILNSARMSTATTGTGTVTLGTAVAKYLTFAEAGAVNKGKYSYRIEEGNDFEIGEGTYTTSGTTFSRDTVTVSKIGGTAGTTKMTLAGAAEIMITARTIELVPTDLQRMVGVLAMQVADLINLPIYTDMHFADSFEVTTYVDTAGATNLNSSTAGVLKPTASGSAVASGTGTASTDGTARTGNWTDGTTAQDDNNCTNKGAASSLYVRKNYSPAKAITQALVYGASNNGFVEGANPSITINMYGKNGGAPSTATDGTLIGTLTFTDTADGTVRTVTSTDTSTAWDYVTVNVVNGGSAAAMNVAECTFYEVTGVNNLTVASNTITAGATVAAIEGDIIVNENVAATANTDYTIEVSADAGSNYTTVTLTENAIVTPDGTRRRCTFPPTAIANTGTSMKWRFKTLNNKSVDLYSVAIRAVA